LTGDFLNFEIFWIFQKIIMPNNLDNTIQIFIKSNKQILGIPIGIDLENGAHANIIIIDKHFKTIERFEPNGSNEPINFNYNKNLLDFILKSYFSKLFIDYKYIDPSLFLPVIGFQSLEAIENKLIKKIGGPGGFCVGWCLWYLEQRSKYLVDPIKLAKKLIIKIKSKNISFLNLIRDYTEKLLDIRNDILNKLDITIIEVVNNNITPEQVKELEKLVKIEVLKYI